MHISDIFLSFIFSSIYLTLQSCGLENGVPTYMAQNGYSELHHQISLLVAKRFEVSLPGAAALHCTKVGNIRSFGQHTNLVNNIRKIIHDYPESSVFGELIQNADDAGATEIHFMYVPTHSSLFRIF